MVPSRPLLLVTFRGGLGGTGPGLCTPSGSSTLCAGCMVVQFSTGRSERKLLWPHRERPAPETRRQLCAHVQEPQHTQILFPPSHLGACAGLPTSPCHILPSKSRSGRSKTKTLQIFRRHLRIERKPLTLQRQRQSAILPFLVYTLNTLLNFYLQGLATPTGGPLYTACWQSERCYLRKIQSPRPSPGDSTHCGKLVPTELH